VSQSTFGLLYQWNVSGSVYAQPLAVSGVPVHGCGSNNPNVVFVATEQDMLYAFCATSSSGQQIWNNSQPTNLAANVKPLNTYQFVDCSTPMNQMRFPVCSAPTGDGDGDNRPSPFTGLSLGVTGTPVIDPSTNTLYVVAAVQNSSDTAMFYYLFAVALQERSRELQGSGGYYGEKLEIEYALAEPASSRKDEMTAEETLNKPVCFKVLRVQPCQGKPSDSFFPSRPASVARW
jgi:hypothetical protein